MHGTVDTSCQSRFAALVAADPHGLSDCPNSVLPAGFDMRKSVDTPCPVSLAPVVAADPPGVSCCPESAQPAESDRRRAVDKSCPSNFAALVAADPHGLSDCPNSVLPEGFDKSIDTSCSSRFDPHDALTKLKVQQPGPPAESKQVVQLNLALEEDKEVGSTAALAKSERPGWIKQLINFFWNFGRRSRHRSDTAQGTTSVA